MREKLSNRDLHLYSPDYQENSVSLTQEATVVPEPTTR